MFAKALEGVLSRLLGGSDFTPVDSEDIALRFEALRAYGRLPAGREHRAARLSPLQIGDAVLGLTPQSPKWAGHASLVLSRLQPVGGPENAFGGAPTFGHAISAVLSDPSLRSRLRGVTLAMSGRAGNVGAEAVIEWSDNGQVRTQGYVSVMAVSLLSPGGEAQFRFGPTLSRAARCLTLSADFFETLAREMAASMAMSEPPGDGAEYQSDDERRARLKRLGVRRNARYLNVGVETQTHWPNREAVIQFEGHDLILMPATRDSSASIHVDLHNERLSSSEAATLINRLLSLMAWEDDAFAILRDGWSGNPIPVAVPARNLARVVTPYWLRPNAMPSCDRVRRALGYYREGLNADEAELVSFSVLSFFKVLELRFGDKTDKVRGWVRRNAADVLEARSDDPRLSRFHTSRGEETVEDYIMTACRIAVAHASVKRPSDPDDMSELSRLTAAAFVLRLLARRMIDQLIRAAQTESAAEMN